ncbi:PTS glucitol/sorbitol transporter subunit IIA [Candidatus Enterococcus ferrettii]|uniref:PTS system, glucitol/sorbitol-specific IIA component n=1 Tax=Candidatus Enterococcus ferrettii TaxID=2815324 RepID=A0ABV0ELY7_9ENTE|nr:PTS glucitol/sorbitol transporter subunit IIA [Enterococcus sp. 665A]MBO1340467.1 PTS glucitol/sorbitol transporter subunit IIA [Enterococcus sp. 665A]
MIRSTVLSVGEMAYFEDYPMLILFNETAPDELKEVCIVHRFDDPIQEMMLVKKGRIILGQQELHIQEIGSVANQNFTQLGHITLQFPTAEKAEVLPGAVLVAESEIPRISAGEQITILPE